MINWGKTSAIYEKELIPHTLKTSKNQKDKSKQSVRKMGKGCQKTMYTETPNKHAKGWPASLLAKGMWMKAMYFSISGRFNWLIQCWWGGEEKDILLPFLSPGEKWQLKPLILVPHWQNQQMEHMDTPVGPAISHLRTHIRAPVVKGSCTQMSAAAVTHATVIYTLPSVLFFSPSRGRMSKWPKQGWSRQPCLSERMP